MINNLYSLLALITASAVLSYGITSNKIASARLHYSRIYMARPSVGDVVVAQVTSSTTDSKDSFINLMVSQTVSHR